MVLLASSAPTDLPPPAAAASEIRRAAEEILSRPEFQEPPRSLYQRVLDAIGERLGDALGALLAGGVTSLVAWAVLVVLVGAVVLLVVRGVQRDARRRAKAAPEPVATDADARRPAVEWDAEAARLEAAGDWRGAVRCRYRSLVARLAGSGVVDEVPGRTAGEYRAAVGSARPGAAGPFGDATDLFERAWYGAEPTGPAENESFDRLAGDVLAGSRG